MAELTVYGSSDDLIEIGGVEGADEFNEVNGHWSGVIEAPNGDTAILYVDCRSNGCWTAALGLYEEDYLLPDWPVTVTAGEMNTYSTFTTITVPDGTKITEIHRSDR